MIYIIMYYYIGIKDLIYLYHYIIYCIISEHKSNASGYLFLCYALIFYIFVRCDIAVCIKEENANTLFINRVQHNIHEIGIHTVATADTYRHGEL